VHIRTARAQAQMLFLSAATQYALITVLAGLAFTITTFPNTSLLPALVCIGVFPDHPNTGVGRDEAIIVRSASMCGLMSSLTSLVQQSFTGKSALATAELLYLLLHLRYTPPSMWMLPPHTGRVSVNSPMHATSSRCTSMFCCTTFLAKRNCAL